MTDKELKLPLYAKATIFLIGLLALFTIMYIARAIIVPLVFSTILAIVLHPIVNFFLRRKLNRVIAIAFTLLLTFIVIAGLGAFIFSQLSRLSESWPVLVDKFTLLLNQTITQLAGYFDMDPQNIHEWILKTKNELIDTSSASIGQTIMNVGNAVVVLLLVPVYIFIILYYQPLLLDFIHKLFGKGDQTQVSEIVSQTKTVIQRYLFGLVIEFVMVAILNSLVLLLLGIDYAILLGIIGAMLNVIPYIGGIVGTALPMMVALVTKDSALYAIYVLAAYTVVQLIDNNFIVPKIVSSKVRINALFSIIAVIAGGALWGIPGMFISIPLLAIVKLIFDHIGPLKPWGFLLGDTLPPILIIKPVLRKMLKKTK